MTGSERILARIQEEADAAGEALKQQAATEAASIRAAAESEAAALLEAERARAQKTAETRLANARSTAALRRRDALLSRRRAELQTVLQETVASLQALPDAAYFEALLPLLRENLQPGQGTLRLNARDLQRDTAVLREALAALPQETPVSLSDQPADIDGGFLLVYDEVEMNASFASLLHEKREALEDAVGRILFDL